MLVKPLLPAFGCWVVGGQHLIARLRLSSLPFGLKLGSPLELGFCLPKRPAKKNLFQFATWRHSSVKAYSSSSSNNPPSRLPLEDDNPPHHLRHGKMALGNAEHRRESTGSGSSLNDDRKRPFLIGVAGGTASGKVCDEISCVHHHFDHYVFLVHSL
jgi:hypothetical protein